ncbi:MAG: hypothetical protein ACK4YD_04090 [Chitinophagia bacterium]|jgi:hypothetical protein
MQFTESTPRQAEHFEWMNAIDFFQSYLDIMGDRFNTILSHNGQVDKQKLSVYGDMLEYLRDRLNDIRNEVNAHLEEVETGESFENRLNMSSQDIHHFGVKEKIDLFEEMLSGFRTEFNEFYVNNL